MKRGRASAVAAVIAAGLGFAGHAGLQALDRAYPPPLPSPSAYSVEVVDRDGALLRAFAVPDAKQRQVPRRALLCAGACRGTRRRRLPQVQEQ